MASGQYGPIIGDCPKSVKKDFGRIDESARILDTDGLVELIG